MFVELRTSIIRIIKKVAVEGANIPEPGISTSSSNLPQYENLDREAIIKMVGSNTEIV